MTANTHVTREVPILLYVRLCDPEEERVMTARTLFTHGGANIAMHESLSQNVALPFNDSRDNQVRANRAAL